MMIVVRHGQTADNAAGLLLGRADAPLSPIGEREAVAAAAVLRDGPGMVSRVVASPLQRARSTAAVIASACGAPMSVDERWVELDYGELDRQPYASVPAELWARWRADVSWTPPGGESFVTLGERVRAACDELAADAMTDHVVVVSHVSPIKAAVAWALGAGDDLAWRLYVGPASITRIGVTPAGAGERRLMLHSFNETAHITGMGPGR